MLGKRPDMTIVVDWTLALIKTNKQTAHDKDLIRVVFFFFFCHFYTHCIGGVCGSVIKSSLFVMPIVTKCMLGFSCNNFLHLFVKKKFPLLWFKAYEKHLSETLLKSAIYEQGGLLMHYAKNIGK